MNTCQENWKNMEFELWNLHLRLNDIDNIFDLLVYFNAPYIKCVYATCVVLLQQTSMSLSSEQPPPSTVLPPASQTQVFQPVSKAPHSTGINVNAAPFQSMQTVRPLWWHLPPIQSELPILSNNACITTHLMLKLTQRPKYLACHVDKKGLCRTLCHCQWNQNRSALMTSIGNCLWSPQVPSHHIAVVCVCIEAALSRK